MSDVVRLLRIAGAASGAAAGAAAVFWTQASTDLQFQLASATGPIFRLLDAETAHRFGILAASWGLFPKEIRPDSERLNIQVWGKTFPNPIGLAAGFDKDAEAAEALLNLGLGFMEVGSVTPQPQPGNPKPRCFRLSEHQAVINRYGFNSKGADDVGERLKAYTEKRADERTSNTGLLGVNLGKNKTNEDAASDYCVGVEKLARYADFLVINISSPNTPGLRALQGKAQLQHLVRSVQAAMDKVTYPKGRPPLLVKIAPDLTEQDKDDIAAVMLATGVDGLVVGNTTLSRPDPIATHRHGDEAGGLSGAPLFELSTQVLRDMYTRTGGKIPLIGCGGVGSGKQAYAKIRAGASLVELYTSLAFQGPALVPSIKRELLECLDADGFACVQDAVAADHRPPPAQDKGRKPGPFIPQAA